MLEVVILKKGVEYLIRKKVCVFNFIFDFYVLNIFWLFFSFVVICRKSILNLGKYVF